MQIVTVNVTVGLLFKRNWYSFIFFPCNYLLSMFSTIILISRLLMLLVWKCVSRIEENTTSVLAQITSKSHKAKLSKRNMYILCAYRFMRCKKSIIILSNPPPQQTQRVYTNDPRAYVCLDVYRTENIKYAILKQTHGICSEKQQCNIFLMATKRQHLDIFESP